MSTERDELIDEIAGHTIGSGYYSTSVGIDEAREIADDLLAAGYRKPRRVTTREDLDALPVDSVVLSHTIAYQYYGDEAWSAAGRFYDSSQISFPAYVLHEPTVHAA